MKQLKRRFKNLSEAERRAMVAKMLDDGYTDQVRNYLGLIGSIGKTVALMVAIDAARERVLGSTPPSTPGRALLTRLQQQGLSIRGSSEGDWIEPQWLSDSRQSFAEDESKRLLAEITATGLEI